MRRLFILLLTVALAGCQSEPSRSSAVGAVPDYSNDPSVRRYEVMSAMLEYYTALNRACSYDVLNDSTGSGGGVVLDDSLTAREECSVRKIRGSLSFMDVPETACQQRAAKDLLFCMLAGSSAARLIAAAGSDADELMNWDDAEASLKLGGGLLATRAVLNCGNGAKSACVSREVGAALLLPAESVERCAGQYSEQMQVRCLAIEFMLDHIRSATLYLE